MNVQMRWAKVDLRTLGSGHSDTWNLFYQSNSSASGTQPAWMNAGMDYKFAANGKLDPAINRSR